MIHVNRSHSAGVLKGHHDVLGIRNDLKWVGHIHGARHARQIAFDFRIAVHSIRKVFLLFLQRLRLIGNRAALHDAETGRNGKLRTELPEGTRRCAMPFDIPICGVHGLPDSIQFRFAGGSASVHGMDWT